MNNGWVTPLDTLSCRTCPTRPSFWIVMNSSAVTAQNHLALHWNELHKTILHCIVMNCTKISWIAIKMNNYLFLCIVLHKLHQSNASANLTFQWNKEHTWKLLICLGKKSFSSFPCRFLRLVNIDEKRRTLFQFYLVALKHLKNWTVSNIAILMNFLWGHKYAE